MLTYSAQPPQTVFYSTLNNPVAGKLLIGETEGGKLCRVSFLNKNTVKDVLADWIKEWPRSTFKRTGNPKIKQLQEHMPLLLVGTPFQYEVWQALLTIPAGKTISYGELARSIGRPKAIRAVGTALGKNPLALILPCHRVIASDGTLGGFGGGLTLKEKLLNFEDATI